MSSGSIKDLENFIHKHNFQDHINCVNIHVSLAFGYLPYDLLNNFNFWWFKPSTYYLQFRTDRYNVKQF